LLPGAAVLMPELFLGDSGNYHVIIGHQF